MHYVKCICSITTSSRRLSWPWNMKGSHNWCGLEDQYEVRTNGKICILTIDACINSAYVANRVTDKLTPVMDRIYCCRSGSAIDTQAIAVW